MSNQTALKLFGWLVLAFVAQVILLPYIPSESVQHFAFNAMMSTFVAFNLLIWRYAPKQQS